MRGIKECLTWMLANPMKELVGYYDDGTVARRRFNDEKSEFEWLEGFSNKWFKLDGLKAYSDMEWYIYNPPVEFHEAYMDCLENGVEYLNEQGDISLTRDGGKVALQWNIDGLMGYDLNHGKWTKQL